MRRNGYQHMVLDDYVHQVRRLHQERKARLAQITTAEQATIYRQMVREAIAAAFGPRPPKTPLRAQVTGVIDRPAYRIEKVTFESRPGFLVTANLYLPKHLTAPAPCVLGTCGHAEAGKASDLYQGFSQRLARAGFVVLIYDPINQGERDQYYKLSKRTMVDGCCAAHNMMGKQLELLGDFFGMWRAWDGIRALDYLLSRPEVDPERVGLTGNSGGGTMTTWLWALEDRFTMAAPGCFITTFLHNLENELPADCEQCPPGVIGVGLEMADFLIAGAPKPLLLLGQTYDYFDRRGLKAAYTEIERFWALLNAPPETVQQFIGPHGHGYLVENQQAMVDFFARQAGLPPTQIVETEVLPEEALYATPQGNVIAAGATPIYSLIANRARTIADQRPPLNATERKSALQQGLALPGDIPCPHYRILRPARYEDAAFARYAIETENDIRAILWKRPAQPDYRYSLDVEATVHLYLPHFSAEADLALDQNSWINTVRVSPPLYALDVRGLGESAPEEENPGFFQPYGMDYMLHAYGLMLGRSYLGRRLYDLLCTMELLAAEGAATIHLYGRGQGSLLALLAGLFDDRAATVTLHHSPQSWLAWTQTPLVTWPAANFLRGGLAVCDLPDCMQALGERLQIIEPWAPDRDMTA